MKVLKYYAFDFDDNILCLETTILMDRFLTNGVWIPVELSTSEFANVRNRVDYRYRNNDADLAFSNFRDKSDNNIFIEDIIKSLSDKAYGPSWNDFKECLLNGCPFAIITARGHSNLTIRKAIEFIIDNELTREEQSMMYDSIKRYIGLFASDRCDIDLDGLPSENDLFSGYLDLCEFHGVSHPSFGDTPTEISKVRVLSDFKRKINDFVGTIDVKAMLGFSDDDKRNIDLMLDFANKLQEYPNILEFIIKDTSDTPSNYKFKNPK